MPGSVGLQQQVDYCSAACRCVASPCRGGEAFPVTLVERGADILVHASAISPLPEVQRRSQKAERNEGHAVLRQGLDLVEHAVGKEIIAFLGSSGQISERAYNMAVV